MADLIGDTILAQGYQKAAALANAPSDLSRAISDARGHLQSGETHPYPDDEDDEEASPPPAVPSTTNLP